MPVSSTATLGNDGRCSLHGIAYTHGCPGCADRVEAFAASIGLPPFQRWYRFGWRSPEILWKRGRVSRWPFRLRMAWQRALRGYGDDDLWNLDHTLAKLTVIGARYLRERGHGHPGETTPEEWDAILVRIEEGFQAWLDDAGWFTEKPEQEAKFKDAMGLYAHWFGGLWD